MKIALGADHAGVELKEKIRKHLEREQASALKAGQPGSHSGIRAASLL